MFHQSETELTIGSILVQHDAVLPQQMEESLDQAARWRMPLSDVLLSKWWLREEVYRRAVACYHALPFIRLSHIRVDKSLLDPKDIDFYLAHLMIPTSRNSDHLVIALTDPGPKSLLLARQKWGSAISCSSSSIFCFLIERSKKPPHFFDSFLNIFCTC